MCQLLGIVVRQIGNQVLFRVNARLGDAPQLRFPDGGEFWVNTRQCVLVCATEKPVGALALDELRLPWELASLKAQALIHGGC